MRAVDRNLAGAVMQWGAQALIVWLACPESWRPVRTVRRALEANRAANSLLRRQAVDQAESYARAYPQQVGWAGLPLPGMHVLCRAGGAIVWPRRRGEINYAVIHLLHAPSSRWTCRIMTNSSGAGAAAGGRSWPAGRWSLPVNLRPRPPPRTRNGSFPGPPAPADRRRRTPGSRGQVRAALAASQRGQGPGPVPRRANAECIR
jgi:hypothetical protein